MAERLSTGFSDSDILFLIETIDHELLDRMAVIKGDPAMVEGMLDQEIGRVFRRLMSMSEEKIMARVSPRFFFGVMLRKTLRELEGQTYTVERTASYKIPVFDSGEVARFLGDRAVLSYLTDMLSSFTRVESFTVPVRVRKGIWRKIRFSDMDIDSLAGVCEAVDEEHRFVYYKRAGDLCLFILGMFPEYAPPDFSCLPGGDAQPLRKLRRSAEDYERDGRRFYKLAGEHRDAGVLGLAEVLGQLHDRFDLARKPLNHISGKFIQLHKQKLFFSLPPN